MLDLRRLQIFLSVCETGSFSAAGRQLYMTQSAVSQQMAALEREFGVTLVIRVPRGVVPTPAGEALAARATRLIGEITDLGDDIRAFEKGHEELRLGAFATAGAELLPVALKTFMATWPDVRVFVTSVHPDEAIRRLGVGDFQVLLTWDYSFAPAFVDSSFAQSHLPDDPLRVVLPVDHPLAGRQEIALEDLAEEQWVVRAHRPAYQDAHEVMCRIAGFEPNIVFRADDYQSVQGLVAAGIGVSLIPGLSLLPLREGIAIRKLSEPTFSRRISIVTHADARPGGAVMNMVEALHAAASDIFSAINDAV